MTIENKYLLSLKKSLRKNAPVLLSFSASLYYRLFQLKDEKAYVKGHLESDLETPSLLLLSCNRAATQLVEEVLRKIYEYGGGKYVALNRYLFFTDKNAEDHMLDADHMKGLMDEKGFFFGQQGPFEDHSVFQDFKRVVMCRDPRDLLVSHFYSFTQAHVPRNKHFVQKMKEGQEMGLQKYVLLDEHVSYFKKCLEQAVLLRDQEGVLFCKYEDMMDDFASFQESCQELINGDINATLSAELNSMYKKPESNQSTDNTRHRRSGAWGQFRNALKPETIEKLNHEFKELLEALDYPI
jgi:hypothetical protein